MPWMMTTPPTSMATTMTKGSASMPVNLVWLRMMLLMAAFLMKRSDFRDLAMETTNAPKLRRPDQDLMILAPM